MGVLRRVAAGVSCAAVLAAPPLGACGDKFLVGTRGTLIYRSAVGASAAAVLIYGRSGSAIASLVVNQDPVDVLRKEGYRASVASGADVLRRDLAQEPWDLVLADVADAPTVPVDATHATAPSVLPVLLRPTAVALADARRRFTLALKGPLKNQAFLDAIGDALEQRDKAIDRAIKAGRPR